MGLTVRRKTAKNLAVRRKNERILAVSRKKKIKKINRKKNLTTTVRVRRAQNGKPGHTKLLIKALLFI